MSTQPLKYALSITVLALTWLLLFFLMMFFAELILVPWDTAIDQPALGTLARTVNDFFDTFPGSWSVPALLILSSIWLTLPLLRRHPSASLKLIATNLIFIGVLFLTFTFAAILNNLIFPYPPVMYDPNYHGYHRSVLPGLVMLSVCVAWLLWQRRIRQTTTFTPSV